LIDIPAWEAIFWRHGMDDMELRLSEFSTRYKFNGKGPLSVVLVVTRKLKEQIPPFRADHFLAPQG
jgi:hypothetical protein